MPATLTGTLEEAKSVWFQRPPSKVTAIDGNLAGVTFSIDFDDPTLADDLFLLFGGSAPRSARASGSATFRASLRCLDAPLGWGLLLRDAPVDGREFRFAVEPGGTFESSVDGDWTLISFRGDDEPLIAYDHEVVLFRTDAAWRKAVFIYLFCQLIRTREDVVFLHAGSVAIGDRGILLIGPKGAGKSTTSMALAARGHRFLGDECGAYAPASRSLLPFRRPVGIKPGPRSGAIDRALPRAQRVVRGEGFVRIALEELIEVDASNQAVPLHAVVFLRGFSDEPRLEQIQPTREDIAAMQPILGSLINAAGTQRVFQLVDMLANTRVFALYPADPDRTALYLEEAFSS